MSRGSSGRSSSAAFFARLRRWRRSSHSAPSVSSTNPTSQYNPPRFAMMKVSSGDVLSVVPSLPNVRARHVMNPAQPQMKTIFATDNRFISTIPPVGWTLTTVSFRTIPSAKESGKNPKSSKLFEHLGTWPTKSAPEAELPCPFLQKVEQEAQVFSGCRPATGSQVLQELARMLLE